MASTFCAHALASGSTGNSILIRNGATNILIDAGITIKSLSEALTSHGLGLSSLDAILITHEHGDHTKSALALSKRYGVRLIANADTLDSLFKSADRSPHSVLQTERSLEIGSLIVSTFSVPHDAIDPVGVCVVDSERGYKICVITDAGHVTETMRRAVDGSHLLVIEANHDVHRLHRGSYPGPLKARILSDTGHLSNETAVGLVCEHARQHGPHTAWLAHLSKENNTPKLALGYAKATVNVETGCPIVLDVARRDRPSAQWSPCNATLQLNLFTG